MLTAVTHTTVTNMHAKVLNKEQLFPLKAIMTEQTTSEDFNDPEKDCAVAADLNAVEM